MITTGQRLGIQCIEDEMTEFRKITDANGNVLIINLGAIATAEPVSSGIYADKRLDNTKLQFIGADKHIVVPHSIEEILGELK